MFLALSFLAVAHAEDAKFEGTKTGDEAEKAETHLKANLGGNFSAGNSESIAFNGGLNVDVKWKRNEVGVIANTAIGYGAVDVDANGFLDSSERCVGATGHDCSPTAEMYSLDGRYDRYFSKTSSLYILAGVYHDRFAGYDLRSHGQLGYANTPIDDGDTKLKVEAGVDFANEDYVEGVEPNATKLLALQIAGAYTHNFNANVSFTDGLTVYEPLLTQPDGSPFAPHFTDIRIGNNASITSKMSDKLSISVSDVLAWRNEPVAPPSGFEDESRSNIDNTLSVALVASLL